MFDIGFGEMIALAIIALIVFGPEHLPKVAADAGRMLRQLRQMVSGARNDLQESLGPEFRDLDIADLNPRTFVRKHLLDPADEADADGPRNRQRRASPTGANGSRLDAGSPTSTARPAEPPEAPFDPEAT